MMLRSVQVFPLSLEVETAGSGLNLPASPSGPGKREKIPAYSIPCSSFPSPTLTDVRPLPCGDENLSAPHCDGTNDVCAPVLRLVVRTPMLLSERSPIVITVESRA